MRYSLAICLFGYGFGRPGAQVADRHGGNQAAGPWRTGRTPENGSHADRREEQQRRSAAFTTHPQPWPEGGAGDADRDVDAEGKDAFHCPAPQGQAFLSASNGASQCPVSPAEKGRSDRVGIGKPRLVRLSHPNGGSLVNFGNAFGRRPQLKLRLRAPRHFTGRRPRRPRKGG